MSLTNTSWKLAFLIKTVLAFAFFICIAMRTLWYIAREGSLWQEAISINFWSCNKQWKHCKIYCLCVSSTQGGVKLLPYVMVNNISLPAEISVSTASSLIIPAHHGRLTSGEVMRVAAVVSFLADSMHEISVKQKIIVNEGETLKLLNYLDD